MLGIIRTTRPLKMSQDLLNAMIKTDKHNDVWEKSPEGLSARKVLDDAYRRADRIRRDKKEQEADKIEYDAQEVYMRAHAAWNKAHPME